MARLVAVILLLNAFQFLLVSESLGSRLVEYMIITRDSLAPDFQRLADWKIENGTTAEVRSVEWIEANYPGGVDPAERVRLFIRDAYTNYGTLWVLLGGDAEVVPVRYAYSTFFFGGAFILSDYYYMCLDGDWNADGDEFFGEVEDDVDLIAEVFAGRATISTPEEARIFIDKTIAYEMNPGGGDSYPTSALFLAERLFAGLHGADLAETIAALLPPWFSILKLYTESEFYPGSIELTRQAALEELNEGYGLTLHFGVSGEDNWSLGDSLLINDDVDRLTNAPRYPVVYALFDHTAAFDADDAIGERWLTSAAGGSVAYVGSSNIAFVTTSFGIQQQWFELALADSTMSLPLGMVTAMSRYPFLDHAQFEGSPRWMIFALQLLGDPMLRFRIAPETTGIAAVAGASPAAPRLYPVAPNPVTLSTRFIFDIPGEAGARQQVRLAVYDANGRLIRRLVDGPVSGGRHIVSWDARGGSERLASGVYFLRLEVSGSESIQKAVLTR